MAESVDGAHWICLSTTEYHNTLLATQPKVDDNVTPPFCHPLLLTPSNCDNYYELLFPFQDGGTSEDDNDLRSNS